MIHLGFRQHDVERYSKFSQTAVNIFAGTSLSTGTLLEYNAVTLDPSEMVNQLDFLRFQSNIPIQFTDITINGQKYYQGKIVLGDANNALGAITANFSRAVERQKTRELLMLVTGVALILGIFASLAIFFFSRKTVRFIQQVITYVERLSIGAIPDKITKDYKGELGQIKNNLNMLIYAMSEITHLAEAIASGNLEVDARERSEHDRLMRALNEMVRRLKTTLGNLNKRSMELARSKEAAEAANLAKSLFLANMSHELRTPLNVIMGYSHLLQKDILSPAEQQEYLNTINRNGEHLLVQINDVLEISKIEAGQSSFGSTTFDLKALLGELERMFESSMDTKELQFVVIGIDAVPRYVTTDKNKLRQVLVNLLGNAVKFTEQGGVTLRVAAEDGTAEGMRLKVEVEDTGVGISEDELDKVFSYFEQTESGRAKKSGTGLGLAISRNYVHMMGGDISVTSKEGKGSTFRFEIDIKKGRQKDIKQRGSRQRVMGLQPGQKPPRVLVAEDKQDSRVLLVKILKTAGFEVEEAVNGKEAVDMFNQWRPDFIWMDIRMPVMDGREAARRIKETDAGQSTVVAALTAHALEEEKEDILAAGCDEFVRKPYREQEIFEVMAKHLGLKYVYENEPLERKEKVETEVQEKLEQLAALPADLRLRLHAAAVELDKNQSLKIIEQIQVHDADLASALKTMVHKLEFRRLVNLSQSGKLKPGDIR